MIDNKRIESNSSHTVEVVKKQGGVGGSMNLTEQTRHGQQQLRRDSVLPNMIAGAKVMPANESWAFYCYPALFTLKSGRVTK